MLRRKFTSPSSGITVSHEDESWNEMWLRKLSHASDTTVFSSGSKGEAWGERSEAWLRMGRMCV